jgi:arylsulfatase A-like enzyme
MSNHRISRRKFLGTVAAVGAAAAVTPLSCHALRSTKRNVILVISDSMRRDALGCYGGTWIHTPYLEQFASQGVCFDNAYLSSFPTVPARHDILTGTYTFTYKLWGALSDNTYTLQNALAELDVYTALFADTPHPFIPKTKFNYQRDFKEATLIRGQEDDEYKLTPVNVTYPCDPKKMRFLKNIRQYLRNISDRKVEEDWFCAQTMIKAAEWLENNHKRQPFFLYVDTFDPHEPWDPPASYTSIYDPGYSGQEVIYPHYDRWRTFLTEAEMKHCRALYAGEATLVDRWFGHLWETIQRLGLLDSTLVIFVSDHGMRLGERGYIGKTVIHNENEGAQNFPLYPEICRIPMLAHYPGCKAGTRIQALAQPVQLAATIAEYLGEPFHRRIPAQFDGPSLWRVMQGKTERAQDFVISAPTLSSAPIPRDRVPRATDQPTISDGRWLLVYSCAGWGDELFKKPHRPDYKDKRIAYYTGLPLDPMLFDLEADPDCLNNIYAANKPMAAELHRKFFRFLSDSRYSKMRPDHLPYFSQLENS